MEVTTNPETGETTSSRSPRFTTWVAFLVFSTVTLVSAVEAKNTSRITDSNTKWAIFCASVTFAFTSIVVLMHLHPVTSIFVVGTKLEGVLCIILVAFWAGTVSIVSNANSGLATSKFELGETNTIVNGNLYYFSWAGFVTAVLLLVSYLRGVFGVDVAGEIQTRSARLSVWSGMLASALVVMGSSSDILDSRCPNADTVVLCRRSKYAVALGAIGTIFSLGVVAMKLLTSTAPFAVEAALAVLLVIMNGFGVAFITSAKGPGAPIGNLYYFTWLSFLCSLMLVAGCFDDYKTGGRSTEPENKDSEIQVENLDDNHI